LRKRNIDYLFYNFVWLVVYLLPILLYVIYVFHSGISSVPFLDFLNNTAQLGICSSNVFYSTLISIFGEGGVCPFFNSGSYALLAYVSYILVCTMIQIVFDLFVFLFAVCRRFLGSRE